ncbi:uncharacterized protein RCC_08790 [Ramularia collo-cygni]|uniref:Uncharacterized protein n=1 Tax=Ramularia collo-cygni TaxID=112498 RepID=A0A2D3V840_9PEZI|nr:uncharacterized protein RCC_08790 [Ramularia collo-cygni]CZT23080.1 uncharacterized protein RCC_08790 [Ramularia collo-cygni]
MAPSTSSDMATLSKPPPRPLMRNFPLPRELRDHIYGYLLHADHAPHNNIPITHLPATPTFGRPYSFSLEILRVNKKVGGEARETLHTPNTFITITTQYSILVGILQDVQFPCVVVSNDELGRFKHASMHVDVVPDFNHKHPYFRPVHFVILLRDLKLFCSIFQWFLYSRNPRKGINSSTQAGVWPVGISIRFTLKRTEYSLQTAQRDERLLTPFRNCTSDNLKVFVVDYACDQKFVRSLLSRMTEELGSETPIAWQVLRTLTSLVAFSEEAELRGDSWTASQILRFLVSDGTTSKIGARMGYKLIPTQPHCGNEAARRVEVVLMECTARNLFIQFKVFDVQRASDSFDRFHQAVMLILNGEMYDELLPPPVKANLSLELARCFILKNLLAQLDQPDAISGAITQLIAFHIRAPQHKSVEQDLKALKTMESTIKVCDFRKANAANSTNNSSQTTSFNRTDLLRDFFANLVFPSSTTLLPDVYEYVVPECMQGWKDTGKPQDP